MADKKSDSKPISSHMGHIGSMKKSESKDMAKGPRKFAKREIDNQVERPPKR